MATLLVATTAWSSADDPNPKGTETGRLQTNDAVDTGRNPSGPTNRGLNRRHPSQSDVPYRPANHPAHTLCVLDVHVPSSAAADRRLPTLVWFHGGGLTSGDKKLPKSLRDQPFLVVSVAYRLTPKVTVADCIDDAAAAVAWTLDNIDAHGGDPDRVFVSGHSAGGYLTMMVGLNGNYLDRYGKTPADLRGLIPLSGHTITHFTRRKEMGLDDTDVIVDDMAPLRHVSKDAPPILCVTGDRELELLGRYEENAYFTRMLQVVGHSDATLEELGGFDHGGMVHPAIPLVNKFITRQSR